MRDSESIGDTDRFAVPSGDLAMQEGEPAEFVAFDTDPETGLESPHGLPRELNSLFPEATTIRRVLELSRVQDLG